MQTLKIRKGGSKMYEINYAYSEHDDRFKELSPEDIISRMFDKTDEKGKVFVPAHPYRIGKNTEGRKWLMCVMKWSAEDRDQIIREFSELYDAISEIAAVSPELGGTSGQNANILSKTALAVWRKYCTDFVDGLFEKELERSIDRLIDSELFPEQEQEIRGRRARRTKTRHLVDLDPLPEDEEMFLYWKHNTALKAAIGSRIGYGTFAFDLCIRVKRLYYLMAFGAPAQLIDREAKRVAKYMVLDRYCSGSAEVELIDAYALPLTGIRNVELVRDVLADPALYDMINPEDDFDPEVVNWSSVYYKKTDAGEELIEQYDLFTLYENGSHILAESLSQDKELNPKGIEFSGAQSHSLLGNEWPDFIFFPAEDVKKTDKPHGVKEKDVLAALHKFADALGIESGTIGIYPVPM